MLNNAGFIKYTIIPWKSAWDKGEWWRRRRDQRHRWIYRLILWKTQTVFGSRRFFLWFGSIAISSFRSPGEHLVSPLASKRKLVSRLISNGKFQILVCIHITYASLDHHQLDSNQIKIQAISLKWFFFSNIFMVEKAHVTKTCAHCQIKKKSHSLQRTKTNKISMTNVTWITFDITSFSIPSIRFITRACDSLNISRGAHLRAHTYHSHFISIIYTCMTFSGGDFFLLHSFTFSSLKIDGSDEFRASWPIHVSNIPSCQNAHSTLCMENKQNQNDSLANKSKIQ